MIETLAFGRTGRDSTRTLFGAAAFHSMPQNRADRVFETLLEFGVNHIDTAASYGDSELRIAPWMPEHRSDFFLATKTGKRTGSEARDELHRSLERLGVDQVDLIQLHNLVDPAEWEIAMGPGGALEALVQARDQGLVRFIGVTGHGTRTAQMHLRSLERFDFDSVLLPYNFTLMQFADYRADFDALQELCEARGVAVQTIKSVARRRWTSDEGPHFSWYEPIKDADALRRAVRWVLARPDVFLNTSSDATILRATLEAAREAGEEAGAECSEAAMRQDVEALGIEPLFVRDVSDQI